MFSQGFLQCLNAFLIGSALGPRIKSHRERSIEKDFNKTSFSDINVVLRASVRNVSCTLDRMCLRLIYSSFLTSSPVGGILSLELCCSKL